MNDACLLVAFGGTHGEAEGGLVGLIDGVLSFIGIFDGRARNTCSRVRLVSG